VYFTKEKQKQKTNPFDIIFTKMGDSNALALLQQLRKLPTNRICVNCDTETKLGFGSVCSKYNTFVCDLCKTSHQAFSHRCKSITMSHFAMEEVDQLKEENGGGNVAARAKWLANISQQELDIIKPKLNDPIDKYKRFVQIVYEEKKYYSDSPSGTLFSDGVQRRSESSNSNNGTRSRTPPINRGVSSNTTPVSTSKIGMKSSKQGGDDEPNLLDFDQPAFTSSATTITSSSFNGIMQQPHMNQGQNGSSNMSMFGFISPQNTTTTTVPSFNQPTSSFDPFSSFHNASTNTTYNNGFQQQSSPQPILFSSSNHTANNKVSANGNNGGFSFISNNITNNNGNQHKPSTTNNNNNKTNNNKPKDPFADLLSM
jgi:hypothetical protein